MNTTARWWVPTEARLGPDAVDIEMLAATGDNPRLELGAALLAAHRVGDAACRVAAETPLCDEHSLASALITARAQLGDPMIDAVSKCVDTTNYAALLVRDTLDDADEAAMELYRAAVARGVSPPVAATRVGAVYGVSKGALGKYWKLAIDPKPTPPQVLNDAADRTLFDFVAKLAADEAQEVEVEISKAPTAVLERQAVAIGQDNPSTPYFDARDSQGRFTSLHDSLREASLKQPGVLAQLRLKHGVWGGTAPKVDDGRPSEAAAADIARKKPKTVAELRRAKAAARPKRRPKAKEPEATSRTETARTTATRAETSRAKASRATAARAKAKRAQAFASPAPSTLKSDLDHPADFDAHLNASHPLLEKFGEDDERTTKFHRKLDFDVGYVLDASDAFYLNGLLASSPGRIMRIGHLDDIADHKAEEVYSDDGEQSQYNANIKATANEATGLKAKVQLIDLENLPDDPVASSAERDRLKRDFASENADPDVEYTGLLPEANGEGFVLYTEAEDAATPTIYEYIVERGVGRVDRASGNKMKTSLDPNVAYRVPDPDDFETVYDVAHDVIRKRVYLSQVSDDEVLREQQAARRNIGKAAAVLERPTVTVRPDDPMTPYFDARDSGGRFTSLHSSLADASLQTITPAEAKAKQRPKTVAELRRRQAAMRPKRRARENRTAAEATESRSTTQRAQATRAQAQRTTQRRQLTKKGQQRVDLQAMLFDRLDRQLRKPTTKLEIDPDHAYRVMDAEAFADIAEDNTSFATMRHGKASPVLEVRQEDDLRSIDSNNHKGTQVLAELRRQHFDTQHEIDGGKVERVGMFSTSSLQEQMNFSRLTFEYTQKNVGIVSEHPVDDDVSMMQLHLSGKPETIVMVEFDESVDPNDVYDLIHVQDVYHHDRSYPEDDAYTGGAQHHYNMIVQHWLAVAPSETQAKLRELRSRSDREAGS